MKRWFACIGGSVHLAVVRSQFTCNTQPENKKRKRILRVNLESRLSPRAFEVLRVTIPVAALMGKQRGSMEFIKDF
jgi:hypothetical protein